jgi:hypothetical protein
MKKYFTERNIFLLIIIIALISVIIYFLANQNQSNFNSTSVKQSSNQVENNSQSRSRNLIFIGDSGTGEKNQYKVSSAIENSCKNNICDSMEIIGDVIYDFGVSSASDSQFDTKFEKPYSNLNFPIYIAFGNHDYLGCESCYLEYAKKSAKFKMPSRYYSYKNGEIEIFVIDTENFDSDQNIWLKNSITNSNSKFKIVTGHRPLLTFESEHHNEKWNNQTEFLNTICGKVNLYISGHSHSLEDNGEINNCGFEQLISGGGGQTPRSILGHPANTFNESKNGFLDVFINNEGKLEYRFYDSEGKSLRAVIL